MNRIEPTHPPTHPLPPPPLLPPGPLRLGQQDRGRGGGHAVVCGVYGLYKMNVGCGWMCWCEGSMRFRSRLGGHTQAIRFLITSAAEALTMYIHILITHVPTQSSRGRRFGSSARAWRRRRRSGWRRTGLGPVLVLLVDGDGTRRRVLLLLILLLLLASSSPPATATAAAGMGWVCYMCSQPGP